MMILYKYLTKIINEINKDEKNRRVKLSVHNRSYYENGYKFFKINELKTFVYNNRFKTIEKLK